MPPELDVPDAELAVLQASGRLLGRSRGTSADGERLAPAIFTNPEDFT
jgi:hypothetical protein